jgi:hypothetical protein
MTTRWPPRRTLAPLFLLSGVLAGCSNSDPTPELHPLTGTVTQDGKPANGGGLMFVSEAGGRSGQVIDAPVGPDGTFAARTSRLSDAPVVFRDGAPVGTYKVIYHPPSNGAMTGLQSHLEQRVTVEARANTAVIVIPSATPKSAGVPRDDDPTNPAAVPMPDDGK